MKRTLPVQQILLSPLALMIRKEASARLLRMVLCFLLIIPTGLMAQVNITATSGNPAASYTTLKIAFDSINSGFHGGVISIGISAGTTETASAVLNASGTGSSSYTSISIQPTGGASRTISGAITGPLVDLNGADNVSINGLNAGGNALTFSNTATGNSSTFRFIGDATNNAIENATILGSGTSATFGTVFFSTGTTTGNDNNTIDSCIIDAAGSNLPANSILCSGTATTGIENHNNTISYCEIRNYFSASLATAGLLITAGATDWTITYNKFFQAATRTYTTANTHKAIGIAGAGNNYVITNNTIGYSSNAATGTYTMAGTVATKFIAIDLAVGTTTASSVQGNTIASINLSTSQGGFTLNGILCGINITAGNVNVGNLSGNIFGATTGTGSLVATPTTTQGAIVGINSSSTGTIVIQNNSMGGFTSSSATAAIAGVVIGVNVSGVAASMTITNNTFGNATVDNMRAGLSGTTTGNSIAIGINATSIPTIANYSNNTIQNLSSYGTGTTGYVRGIHTGATASTTATATINNNIIHDLTTSAALVAATSGLTAVTGIQYLPGTGSTIVGNTIYNLSAIGTATTNVVVAGISHGSATNTLVAKNRIYNLTNAGTSTSATAPAVVAGIVIRSGTTSISIQNNMITLGAGQTTNTSFVGIWGNHGSSPNPIDSIVNNTINITGTSAGGAQPSFGFYRGDYTVTARTMTVALINNIITNTRTGGTGGHYAVSNNFGATTPSATGWGAGASNYNILNAAPATVGQWATDLTFAGWQAASGNDANSFSGIAVNYTDSSNNLHLNMGTTPTIMESYAVPFPHITSDFDGDAKPGPAGSVNGGGSVPDLGADEFDGVPTDITPPIISYTNIPLTCTTADRVLSATIVDITGVYTTGSLMPRIYYKKITAPSWSSQQGVLMSGTGTNGTWNFTIVGVDMGGLSTADSVQYYVIAQDSGAASSNISSFPAGVTATDVNSVSAAPSSPNMFFVGGGMTGAYTINSAASTSGSNFQTFGALSYALNTGCLNGPVTIDVTAASGPYTDALVIPSMPGSSSVNTITLNGNNDTLKYTPVTGARHIVKLDGADYVTIKNLNIVGLAADFDWGIHLTNGADHDSILNCRIDMSANTSTAADNCAAIAASASGTDINAQGNNANYLVINGCVLIGGYQTIVLNGSLAQRSTGNRITNDTIRDFYFMGIQLIYNDSGLVEHNDIHRANRVTVTTFEGIELGTGNINTVINANRIHDSHNSATTQTGTAYGIFFTACDAPSGSENYVTNNLVYHMNSTGGAIYGLGNTGSDGAYYYHNTIILDDALTTAGLTRGFYQTTVAANIDIRNNIFYITRTGTGDKNCLYFATATSTITSDKNVLYMNSAAGTNGIGFFASNQATLADWKTVNSSAYDQQSFDIDPLFSAPAPDYTPSAFVLNNAGANVGVLTDITGAARTATPDIGAFEFSPPAIDADVTWVSPVSPVGAGMHTVTVSINNNSAATTITSVELEYTDGTITQSETFTGLTLLPSTGQQLSFATQYSLVSTSNLRAYIKSINGIPDGNRANDTTTLQNICVGFAAGTYTINSALATGSGNFQTFTAAVAAMTSCGIMGPVVFNVDAASGPYTEQITIPEIVNASATNTITFNGNGRTIQATPLTATRHIIRLDGADYVKINNLHIVGLATDFGWGIHLTNGADYNSITNCTIDMNAVTNVTQSNSACIVASGSTTVVTTDGDANYNVIDSNTLMGAYQGIIINGVTGALNAVRNTITHNTIRDFYANGIELTDNDSALIENNNIHRANRVAVTTFEGVELGAGNQNCHVNANRIHDTHNAATTQSGAAYGIFSSANDAPVGAENIVTNNLIYNFNSLTGIQYGLYNSGSNGVRYYHNSVAFNDPNSTSGTTRAFFQTTLADNIDLKNNILYVTRAGSGAKNCIYIATATSTVSSNYNLLYVAGAGTIGIGFYSTNMITFADWKAANGSIYDQQSINANPLFNGVSNLVPSAISPVIGAGTPIAGVTTDYNGAARSVSTPSIGAYENGGDFSGPVFVLGQILNTSATTNRTLNGIAQITDISDVDTSNHKPRIYFKKTSDNNAYNGNTSADNGWKWTEATNTVNPFSFAIDYNIINGGTVAVGDTIQYFIAAQDAAASQNVGISSGILATEADSVDLLPASFPVTGNIAFYRIVPALSGTYTVGTGGNYLNLTEISNALRNSELNGDVLFELLVTYDGTTGEVFPVHFDPIPSTSPLYTVTIRPAFGVSSPLVTAGDPGSANPLISLDGSDRMNFDGRPGGIGDMTNIRWIIRNKRTAATFAPAIRFINDASVNTLQYLEIQSANTVTTSGTVLFSTAAVNGNDSNIIQYNVIRDRSDTIGVPAIGIYSAGTAGAANDHNEVLNNRIFNWTSTGVSITATGNGDNWKINGNHFYYDLTPGATTAQTSINFAAASNNIEINNNYIGSNTFDASGSAWINSGANAFIGITAAFDSLSIASVTGNVIRSIQKTATGAASLTGIIVSKGNANVMNNLIGDTVNPGSITNTGTGVMLGISITNTLANTVTTVDHNRIANLTNGTGIIRGISYSAGSNNPVCHIRFNKIFGLSTNSVTAGYAAGSIIGQGVYFFPTGYTRNCQISDNIVHTIKGNSTTAATNVSGMTITNFDGTISRNTIYNIQNASTVAGPLRGTANGFLFRFLENAVISNNMISLTGNVSDSVQLNGIMITGANGGLHAYVNNSVNVTNTAGNLVSSFAFHRGENSTTTQSYHPVAMKNNIFFNGVTSPGNHYAIGNEGARPDSSWIIAENDYNNLYSVTPGTTTLWGTTPGDLASWKTLSGGDPHSVTQFVQYQDPSIGDLHLAGASIGDFVLAGTPVAEVTTDFDGETKHATYPYMGADESTSSPLPVTLTSFNAKRNGKKDVWVYWSTASETNADRFIVEASVNGKDFKYAGTVKAKGQSVSLTHYQFTHYNAKADMNNSNIIYYRLKSVDKDGSTATSQVVRVLFDKEEMTLDGTSAFPNPFTGNITLSIPSDRLAKVDIVIVDLQGRNIRSTQEQLTEGVNHIEVSDLDNLDTGIYFVKVSVNGDQQVIKMIKH